LLISSGFGRELSCSYSIRSLTFCPTFSYCWVTSVDLSDSFKAQGHSFTGSSAEKLAATMVYFYSSPNVDFIPKEILSEFPHLNGIEIFNCNTFTTVNNGLFTKEFDVLQYVWLDSNKIQTIEPEAFQYLVKLKWISLESNQIQSLPFQIFKNNPELIYISLYNNKINSIDSNLFKNLNKLKFVGLTSGNLCINQDFGCESSTCSVSQPSLNSGLATCFSNCIKDIECTLKSGKFDKFSADYIKENIDAIVSYGHLDVLIKQNFTDQLVKKGYLNLMVENGFLDSLVAQNYLDPLIQNGHLDLLLEKNYTHVLIEKGYKNRIIENDWRLKLAFQDVEKIEFEMRMLKEELADLEMESERREAELKALRDQFNEFKKNTRP
jgi:hypothetical protein